MRNTPPVCLGLKSMFLQRADPYPSVYSLPVYYQPFKSVISTWNRHNFTGFFPEVLLYTLTRVTKPKNNWCGYCQLHTTISFPKQFQAMQVHIIQVGTTRQWANQGLLLKGHNVIAPLTSGSDKKNISLPHTQSKTNHLVRLKVIITWDGRSQAASYLKTLFFFTTLFYWEGTRRKESKDCLPDAY